MAKSVVDRDKSNRGHASQFFVAGELCRRGWLAVVTLGNAPNTDILCSNKAGTRFVHIQVKTFIPASKTCSVGIKAERNFGSSFFWVLGGIPAPGSELPFEYYVIPSDVMADNVSRVHQEWLITPGKKNQPHRDNPVRAVCIPPWSPKLSWDIKEFRERWDLIGKKLHP